LTGLAAVTAVINKVSSGEFDVSFYTEDISGGGGPTGSITTPSISNLTGLLLGSDPFSAIPPTLQHESTSWEISDDVAFSNIVQFSYEDTVNLNTYPLDLSKINAGVTYYARVKYHSGSIESDWSNNFTIFITFTIDKPQITSVVDGREIHSSTYNSTNNLFNHTESDWEVATDNSFTNIVFSSYGDSANLESITISGVTPNTDYYVRVRHRSGVIESSWSDPYQFNSLVYYPTPVLLSPTNAMEIPYNNYTGWPWPSGYNLIVDKYAGDVSVSKLYVQILKSYDGGVTWPASSGTSKNYEEHGVYNVNLGLEYNKVTTFKIELRWYSNSDGYTDWVETIFTVDTTTDLTTNNQVVNLQNSNSSFPNTDSDIEDVYRYIIVPTLLPNTAVEEVQHQLSLDRGFTNPDIDYVYTGSDYSDIKFNLYPSPHHQVRLYDNLLKNIFVKDDVTPHTDYIYYRSRVKVNGLWQRWSSILIYRRTTPTYVSTPVFTSPTEGATFDQNVL
jgi:hypothetical protein